MRKILVVFGVTLCACLVNAQSAESSVLVKDDKGLSAYSQPIDTELQKYRPAKTLAEIASAQNREFGFVWEAPKTKEERYNFSIGFGGWSDHNTHGKPNRFKQQNPVLEFDIWLDTDFLGGRPFIGYAHVFTNSNRGTVDWLMIANQWKLIRGKDIDLCGGIGAAHVRYTYPNTRPGKQSKITGNLPVAYLCLEKGPISARFVPLGKDILFMYFVYSYK